MLTRIAFSEYDPCIWPRPLNQLNTFFFFFFFFQEKKLVNTFAAKFIKKHWPATLLNLVTKESYAMKNLVDKIPLSSNN